MQNSGIKIYDFTPFTQLDFPNTLAAILWLANCNMRCPYCHNPDIVFGKNSLSFDEVIKFLKKRKNLLEGVVISGGEPTLHQDIFEICKIVKDFGYKIKLDTNGSNPKVLKELLKNNLLDYVALDFKATKDKYFLVTKTNYYDKLIESLKLLNDFDIKYEVRTTVHTDLLNEKDIEKISNILKNNGYNGDYYIQNFVKQKNILGDLKNQKRLLNIENLNLDIEVKYRNF